MMQFIDLIARGIISADDVGIPEVNADSNTVTDVLNAIYMIAGVIAVIFVILGGIKYSISQGESGNLQKAKETILYAIVGLAIVIFAFAITNFVVTRL